VLFVDDEEKARKYFALAMAGDFDVKTAGSAAEALDILARHAQHIAIIVSDQRMPEQTGVELLKTVREHYPHIVRLLTTAYTEIEDAIEAINRGEILRYIQKPWDINTLKAELKHAQNYFQLRTERDELLKEKLSVKHSMIQIERISHLLLFAEAIPHVNFAGRAMRRYIDQLVSHRPSASTDPLPLMLDLWSQTLADTVRMKHFVRRVTDALAAILPNAGSENEFSTQLDLPALRDLLQECASVAGPSLQIQIADDSQAPPGGFSVDGPLFRLMLIKLFSVILSRNVSSVTVRLSATGTQSHTGLQMIFEIGAIDFSLLHAILSGPVTQEIPAACADLLLVFLVCVHHGGSVESGPRGGSGGIVLSLPTDPREAVLPADNPHWHANMLATFEPELQ
jgi:two-component system probable response regulator PhcQ